MNKIKPFLWLQHANEATDFYCSIFSNAEIVTSNAMITSFTVSGQEILCMNGGTALPDAAVSFFYTGDTEEINRIWKHMQEGGKIRMPLDTYPWSEKYGWIDDRFGISWQLSAGRLEDVGQRIAPVLMFSGEQNGRAEEALNFYMSIFNDASLDGILRYDDNELPDKSGNVKHAQFEIASHKFMVMDSNQENGSAFNESVSFLISCKDQQEIDHYWNALTDNGEEGRCGWLKDKFGVSWQVVPENLGPLLSDKANGKAVQQELIKMKKINVSELEAIQQ